MHRNNKFFISIGEGVIVIGNYDRETKTINFPPNAEWDNEELILTLNGDGPTNFKEFGASFEILGDNGYEYEVFNDIRDLI